MNNSKISYKSVVLYEDERATKERQLKRLNGLSLKSLGEIPQLDEPTYDQKQWVLRKLKGPASIWRPYC